MKDKDFKRILIFLFMILEAFSSKANMKDGSDKPRTTFAALRSELLNPPSSYRPAPLFVWNDKINRSELLRLMTELKEAGYGGMFIHPRPGLITEYLSKEWFDLFSYTVKQGKKLGIDVWMYDENSYPSGFAAGLVTTEMPEAYNEGSGLTMTKVQELPTDVSGYLLLLKKQGDDFVDITGTVDAERGAKGDFYLFSKVCYAPALWLAGGYPYVDLLHPGVTEKFLEITMTGYEKTVGKEFGKSIKGAFSDEPEISSPGGVRWTVDLFEQFEKQHGYNPVPHLPSLYEEIGNWKKFRHDYTKTLLHLFIDRWAKPSYHFYDQRGLQWTGHYWEHAWPDLWAGGDNMAMYAWFHQPGIDMLFNQFDDLSPIAQFGNVRAVREVASAARQRGRKRVLSETYGGAGWDVTFKDLKRLGDWEFALGINFMNQHLYHYSLSGKRKYDYPPYFSYQSSWFKHYRVLNDYYGRLSAALSAGKQSNDVLVIEPTSTLWLYYSYVYSYTRKPDRLWEVGEEFQRFVTKLSKQQVEYDLGSETIIADWGAEKNGRLVVGEVSYGTVVLPPLTENVERETFELLKQFVSQGGKLLLFSVPNYIDGVASDEWNELLLSQKNVIVVSALTDRVIADYLRDSSIRFDGVTNQNLYHHRRTLEDGELVFLANASLETSTTGTITAEGTDVVFIDLFTGKEYDYPEITESNGKITCSYTLPQAGSMLLFFAKEKKRGLPSYFSGEYAETVQPLGQVEVMRRNDNVLRLEYVDMVLDGGETSFGIHVSDATHRPYMNVGMSYNPWGMTQYKTVNNDRDTTFTGGGFHTTYHFNVGKGCSAHNMRVVVERPELYTLRINGQKVKQMPATWWLDRSFGVFSIGNYVHEGDNSVELSIPRMSVYAETEPIYIIGDFSVQPRSKGFSLEASQPLKLGSWKQQGLPFYVWDVSYQQTFRVDDLSKQYAVQLEDDCTNVAEILVNGRSAGVVAFPPYRKEVSDLLRKGSNIIEVRLTGAMRNLMGPHHNKDKGLADPQSWNAPKELPAGNDYFFADYGMMKPFTLLMTTKSMIANKE